MCTVLYVCALCALYLSKNSVYECLQNINSIPHTKNKFSTLKNKTKLGKQCTMCTVHIQFVKKQWVRMFRKLKFNPAHQKSALYLEKQKSQKNSAKCALCSGRSDLIVPFKPPHQKKLILKISEKCAQISPLFLPFKGTKISKNKQKSLRNC